MKKIFLGIFVLSILSSCLELNEKSKPPIELQPCSISDQSYNSAHSIIDQGENLPNLSLNPLYLEFRTSWYPESVNSPFYTMNHFRLYNTNQGVQSEIFASTSGSQFQNYFCHKNLTTDQFNQLVSLINSAKICKSIVYQQSICNLQENSMIAPSSLYAIDITGPVTINLSSYQSSSSSTSFCDQKKVNEMMGTISSFYDDIDLQKDCVLKK